MEKIIQTLLLEIKQNWRAVLLVVGTFIFLLTVKECKKQKGLSEQRNINFTKTDSFQIVIDKQGEKLSLQQQLIVDSHSKLKETIEENQYLKNIVSQIKVKTQTSIDTLKVPIDHFIYKNCGTSQKYLKVPSQFRKDDKWFKVKGVITDSGYVLFDSIRMLNEPVIQIGEKRVNFIYGIFHKPEVLVSYRDKNPYVRVVSMSNIEVQNNVRKKKVGLGFSIGYSLDLKPYVGVGLNYSILQF